MVDYIVSLYEQLNPDSDVPEGMKWPSFLPPIYPISCRRKQEFAAKREKAVAINEQLQQEAQAVLDVIENPDVAQALRQDKNQNLTYLRDNYGVSDTLFPAKRPMAYTPPFHFLREFNVFFFQVTPEQITALYNFGKFQYTYGNYSGAADYLYHFRVLSTDFLFIFPRALGFLRGVERPLAALPLGAQYLMLAQRSATI